MKLRACVAAFCLLAMANVRAVILLRTGDPGANTTAPTGDLANSGWQYEGFWGGFTGTPIAPHYFISAQHIGDQGNFIYNGVSYTIVAEFNDPSTDLKLLRVAQEFPSFAPLYSRADEVGQRIAEFGRGTERGSEITLGGVLKGWNWGPGDGVLRWGENIVSGIYPNGPEDDLLFANFDQNGLPNECHLSVGDSAGAAFINDNGVWKLAGINYAVDGPFYTDAAGNGEFNAALFDTSGFYAYDGTNFVPISGPSALYPTRISSRLPWIARTIAEPALTHEGNSVAFIYTRLIMPTADLQYVLEQSTDLINWTTAAPNEQIISSNGSVEVVKDSVSSDGTRALFLRLRITR